VRGFGHRTCDDLDGIGVEAGVGEEVEAGVELDIEVVVDRALVDLDDIDYFDHCWN